MVLTCYPRACTVCPCDILVGVLDVGPVVPDTHIFECKPPKVIVKILRRQTSVHGYPGDAPLRFPAAPVTVGEACRGLYPIYSAHKPVHTVPVIIAYLQRLLILRIETLYLHPTAISGL